MKLKIIYRHPVKGLKPESLSHTCLNSGFGVPYDRAFGFLWDDDSLPENVRSLNRREITHVSKKHLLQQHDWPCMARWSAKVNNDTGLDGDRMDSTISVFDEGDVLVGSFSKENESDVEKITDSLGAYLKANDPFVKAYHPSHTKLKLLGCGRGLEQTRSVAKFTDRMSAKVSVGFVSSLDDFSEKQGFKLDPRRFRLNLWVEGSNAWDEMKRGGKLLKIGQATLKLSKPIGRCPNINVDPDLGTANVAAFESMLGFFGHGAFGVQAEVVEDGFVSVNDTAEII